MITTRFSSYVRSTPKFRMRTNSSGPATRPRLPVPDLRKTLDRYLQSIKPYILEDEARGGPPFSSSYDKQVKLAQDFESGIGKVCQERLLALDQASPHNWLDDNFWTDKAYLEGRAPLPINSNWWLAFAHDSNISNDTIQQAEETGGVTPWQVRRAAWLTHRVLCFKECLARQELYPETTRTGVWLRESTSKIFNTSRLPQVGCDVLVPAPPPNSSPDSRKLLVMVHDWCYAVEVYDSHDRYVPAESIEKRLQEVVLDAQARLANGDTAVPVSVLSADERDQWAKNLQHLLSLSSRNASNLRTINHSVFALSLDHHVHTLPSSYAESPAQRELDAHLHSIRSSPNAHDRWFDKAFTLIVDPSARAGAMGEHSPCDALVPSIVAEYALAQDLYGGFERAVPEFVASAESSVEAGQGWERLDWDVDTTIISECREAEERARASISDSDDSVLWFTDYGAEWIKEVAKLSPDAYLQMVLQLAWYRTRGHFTATYETALTRMFDRGRTETIRTLTVDSRAFVLAMVDPSATSADRLKLLRRAVQTHSSLTREAATGRGIDRHLLGLQLMLEPSDNTQPSLFDDPIFERSKEWKLSTSGLSAGHLFRGTGFGAAYPDGYGINYLAGPEIIKFGIESKHSNPYTSTSQLKQAVVEAMADLKLTCSTGSVEKSHL
ncbi:hypothetical protein PLICRDRAFT_45160 [Plicaturopsis crispa FD-325 SS-3]|uniref:Choline/carnitine acyltransferase domain-containing protein n=1 Tax=Plicaturopsis crispa FD-325 SS-3 TaxID=944288 RepID=A0A0C9T6U4_PLICR|nr:hypothetical protein PLICRDRAFT_45160 [Plicaturopsis crispa FD-325 SS-3]